METYAKKPLRKADIYIQEMGDESALCSLENGEIHFLNLAAKLIWELCDGEHSTLDMEGVFRSTFALDDTHDVLTDIDLTLAEFQSKNLIEFSATPALASH